MQEIEARLAAYVDGTLPADQRAEIEAYLKANANHGRLIAELKSIKAAVTTLPKEKAPAEVLDGLQAHLERHQLLEDVEDSVGSSRIQRWPQVGALAAVLMLAAGLGILVYVVLPKRKGPPPELAMLPEVLNTQPTGSDEVPPGGATLNEQAAGQKPMMAARSAGAEQQYQSQMYNNGMSADQQIGAPTPATPAVPELARAATPAASPQGKLAGPTRVLTITTDDPILTANLVAGYFAQANLNFQRVASVDSVLPTPANAPFGLPGEAGSPAATQSAEPLAAAAVLPAAPAAAALPTTQPTEVVVLRALSPVQLADAETAVRAQRFTRQRAKAEWVGRADVLKDAATQPATLPVDAIVLSTQPALPNLADAAAPRDTFRQEAGTNLVIVVLPDAPAIPAATQPATPPATLPAAAETPVELPAAPPATLPTTMP